jgi:hypothetical protein
MFRIAYLEMRGEERRDGRESRWWVDARAMYLLYLSVCTWPRVPKPTPAPEQSQSQKPGVAVVHNLHNSITRISMIGKLRQPKKDWGSPL